MQKEPKRALALVPGIAALLVAAPGASFALDEDAATALMKKSDCTKCHSVDKKKEAPPWKELAAKLKGKADAQATVIKHITTGPKVKLEDGSEEDHPVIKTKNQDEIKNLTDWILSL